MRLLSVFLVSSVSASLFCTNPVASTTAKGGSSFTLTWEADINVRPIRL